MTRTRTEHDSMGELEVPADALYGAQTQRAINNFPVSGQRLPENFIRALLLIKAAAASTNLSLGLISKEMAEAIQQAARELLDSEDLMQHFPVDVFQTGSGTSSNMNANEVLARLASQNCSETINPNDHVNLGQSSNDVIPTCIHVSAALALQQKLLPALQHLVATMLKKADAVQQHVKTGRTHLMDAMPVRLSQELQGWALQIENNMARLTALQPDIQTLAQGGTAVGTGVNAHPDFARELCAELSSMTSLRFSRAENYFSYISSQDSAVALSAQLKTTAV